MQYLSKTVFGNLVRSGPSFPHTGEFARPKAAQRKFAAEFWSPLEAIELSKTLSSSLKAGTTASRRRAGPAYCLGPMGPQVGLHCHTAKIVPLDHMLTFCDLESPPPYRQVRARRPSPTCGSGGGKHCHGQCSQVRRQ
jgi:hypothetical protein